MQEKKYYSGVRLIRVVENDVRHPKRFPVNEKSALRKERLCYKNNSNGKAICQELPVNSNRETKKQVVIATEYAYNDKRI